MLFLGNSTWNALLDREHAGLRKRLVLERGTKSLRSTVFLLTFAAGLVVSLPHALAQDGGQAAPQPGSGIMTLKANVRRVAVDVVVTDSKDHPVRGLSREDFEVLEDGVPQVVRSFDAHVIQQAPETSLADHLQLPPNTFVNLVRAPSDSPVTVILYDVLNTPADAMPYAHDAMVKFIKSQKGSSRIAIFVLGSGLRMLQGFTDDETRLIGAVNSKAAGTQQSTLLMADHAGEPDPTVDTTPGDQTAAPSEIANLKSLETTEAMMMQRQRLEQTVNAFAQIARFLSTLPGRKNVIWMSGSFPTAVLPNGDIAAGGTQNEFGDTYSLADDVKRMNDLLNEYHISIYPVDVRGLQVNPMFSAAGKRPPPVNASSSFGASQAAEHSTMDEIAESTGGRAFYNTNGLAGAMQSAQEQGSIYYSLSYAPTNPKYDGSLRRITLRLKEPGYRMSYRRSYFAEDPNHAGTALVEESPRLMPDSERSVFLDAGMKHGAPISSELIFETSVNPVGGASLATAQEMEQLTKFMVEAKGKKQSGPTPVRVQHYRIDYVILGRQLDLPEAGEGKYRSNMMFAVGAFTPDSLVVNGVQVLSKNILATAQYQKIRAQGYQANLDFVVPVEASSMRIAVRDEIGGRMGSIEIPLPVARVPDVTK